MLRLQEHLHAVASEAPLPNMWYAFIAQTLPHSVLKMDEPYVGQVYCSRCASNILKGSRFGQEGVVRTCNLCLTMIDAQDEKYDDDDDDRRSVVSSSSFAFPPHQLESVQSAYAGPLSPFSPQTLLAGYSFDNLNQHLTAIPEGSHGASGSGSFNPSNHQRMPAYSLEGMNSPTWEQESSASAPFRGRILDDDANTPRDDQDTLEQYLSDSEDKPSSLPMKPSGSGGGFPHVQFQRPPLGVAFPALSGERSESFISFPGSSSPDGADSPRPYMSRSRVSSSATDVDTPPFLRSRVPSRLAPSDMGVPWRTRRDSTA